MVLASNFVFCDAYIAQDIYYVKTTDALAETCYARTSANRIADQRRPATPRAAPRVFGFCLRIVNANAKPDFQYYDGCGWTCECYSRLP